MLNPLVDMGTDQNGFSYKKYANGEAEWRKKIRFTTPEWSGTPNLYYCNADVYEVPENVKTYGAICFAVSDASGAQAYIATISPYPDRMYFSMARVYGGMDSIRVTGTLIINGTWK